jgi:hypothetical protein
MKKIITLITSLILLFGLSACIPTKDKDPVQPAADKTSYLFVIQAPQGKVVTQANKKVLQLNKAEVNRVIMFSDRPQRIVKIITGEKLQKLWKQGTNSFEQDPPNAVLSATNKPAKIIILNSFKVTDNTIEMQVKGDQLVDSETLKDVTIVIDDYCTGKKDCAASTALQILAELLEHASDE